MNYGIAFNPLVIGDLHYKVSNISEMLEFEAELLAIIKERRPQAVIFLGDSLNDHETIHTSALNAFQSMVLKVSRTTAVILLIGNHDLVNNQCFLTTEHPFNAMKLWPRVTVVDKPQIQFGYLFVPYVPNGRFIEAIETLPQIGTPLADPWEWKKVAGIFAHQEFMGASLGPIQSQTGDVWPVDYPPVFSGHLHDRHKPQANVQYIGIPADRDFGKNPRRTISVLHFKEDKTWTEELIEMNQPRKLTFDLTIQELLEFQPPERAHCRVHLSGTSAELAAFRKSKQGKLLEKQYKIIGKPSDEVYISTNRERKKYIELLKESCDQENDWALKKAFDEVTQNDSQA